MEKRLTWKLTSVTLIEYIKPPKAMANSKIAPFYKRSCNDCILLGLCDDQKASNSGDYVCRHWDWRYE